MRSLRLLTPALLLLIQLPALLHGQIPTPGQHVQALANLFVEQSLKNDLTVGEQAGLPFADHSRFVDLSPPAIKAFAAAEFDDLRNLHTISPDALTGVDRATYAVLEEQLESDLQMRVCRTELWDVNHFSGWQSNFADVADRQPVATAEDRAQALKRWASLPQYLDRDIANLREGERLGYSAPQSIVRRVIAQMDSFLAATPENLPFYAPARRSGDIAFQRAFRQVLVEQITPALQHYRTFLAEEYLARARSGIAVSDLPNGAACYQAFLRQSTTLHRTPAEVYALGEKTVARYDAEVRRLGQQAYGTTDRPTILKRMNSAPANHFTSRDELLAYSRSVVDRAKDITSQRLIAKMPVQGVVIEPEPTFEDQAGVSSQYVNNPNLNEPSTFRIELGNWATETRAEAQVTTVHETWPGHHLQMALARELVPNIPLFRIVENSAYAEGWARYAEAMGEDVGIYQGSDALIQRRIWPAHGLVVDPGLHAMHWSRQQAVDYLVSSGRFNAKEADDTVDRIAVMPGQLTSYDSGGLEIFALRNEAQRRLGSHFDLKAFNLAVLNEGSVPLPELERHIRDWIGHQR